ncbi:MAG: MFS transporter [Actinomycetota bacterium]
MTALKLVAGRTFRSLGIRNYRLYFMGQIVSFSGTWMQLVAQMWLVFRLTGSGVALGVTTALQFLPMLLVGAWGGVVADRFDKRRLLMATQATAASLALVLAVLTATGIVRLWMIYVLALLLGCVTVVDNPTRQSFVIEMVGPDEISNAVGLNSAVFTSARVVGPAIAGVLIATFDIVPCFFVNAVSYLAVIAALWAMDPEELHTSPRAPRGKGQLREGLRYVWSTRELRIPLLLMAVVGTLAFNFRVLLPVMADETFGGGAGTYGVLSAVMGAGTVIGALVVASRRRPTRPMLVGSALAYGALIVIAGLMPTLAFELAVLVPMGAAGIGFVSTANSMLQLNSSDAMRGRVMALYAVVFLGSTPIGSPLIGWIAERFGVRAGFLVGGVATLIAAAIALWTLGRGKLRALATRVSVRTPDDAPFSAPAEGSFSAPAEPAAGPAAGGDRRGAA